MIEEKQVIINDLLVNYFAAETDPAAPTVVFLHGWRSEARVWMPVLNSCAATGKYNLYALDFPGFGKSEKPKQAYKLDDFRDIVLEFCKKLNLEKISLVGHSFGGRVAIKLTIVTNVAIEKLVLVDSAGFKTRSAKKGLLNTIAKITKPAFKLPGVRDLRPRIYKLIGAEDYLAADTPEIRQTFLNIINEDLTADMKKVKVPTLILWGADDKDTPVNFGKRLHSAILNSKFEILPHAGHFSFLDDPRHFVASVIGFLDQNV